MGSSETTPSTATTPVTTTSRTMPTKNIIVVSTPSLAANRARRGGTDKNYSLWGGGSTTVVSPDGGSNGDVILAELECVPCVGKYKVNTENTARPRANKRKAEEDLMDPEEDEKRKMRRNRNRLAAARCRQKRLDQVQPSLETVKPQRPGSLSLIPVNNIEGVSIDTPSNGILSFNTLLEGKTGLTPTNILSPTSLWGPVKIPSALNTPNCGSQERKLIVTDLLSPSTQALLTSL